VPSADGRFNTKQVPATGGHEIITYWLLDSTTITYKPCKLVSSCQIHIYRRPALGRDASHHWSGVTKASKRSQSSIYYRTSVSHSSGSEPYINSATLTCTRRSFDTIASMQLGVVRKKSSPPKRTTWRSRKEAGGLLYWLHSTSSDIFKQ